MVTWVEKNRVYSNGAAAAAAAVEIDSYAKENGLRLSVESQPRTELRGTRQVFLKRILGKTGDAKGKPGVKPFVGLRR